MPIKSQIAAGAVLALLSAPAAAFTWLAGPATNTGSGCGTAPGTKSLP